MTLSQIKTRFVKQLLSVYPNQEIDSIFTITARQLLNYSKIEIHLSKDEKIQPDTENKFLVILDRLSTGEPIQYILEETEFYGIKLKVDRRALIPRPETEYMLDIALQCLPKNKPIDIIDLCTGSGCIAIALAKNIPLANITATDISNETIKLAEENSNTCNTRIRFVEDDLLIPSFKFGFYNFMISNPPYVRDSEKAFMHKNVLDFEPATALFVPDSDPFLFYRAIAEFGKSHLYKKGIILVEINENFGNETADVFLKSEFDNVEIIKDLQNKDRFIKAFKNGRS
jgi:release factor glutamine methyltransferase